jgi:hypothetical protein
MPAAAADPAVLLPTTRCFFSPVLNAICWGESWQELGQQSKLHGRVQDHVMCIVFCCPLPDAYCNSNLQMLSDDTVLRQHCMKSDIATAAGTPLRVGSVRGGFLCLDIGMGKTALGIALQLLRPADEVWRSEGQVWHDSMLDCKDTGD